MGVEVHVDVGFVDGIDGGEGLGGVVGGGGVFEVEAEDDVGCGGVIEAARGGGAEEGGGGGERWFVGGFG